MLHILFLSSNKVLTDTVVRSINQRMGIQCLGQADLVEVDLKQYDVVIVDEALTDFAKTLKKMSDKCHCVFLWGQNSNIIRYKSKVSKGIITGLLSKEEAMSKNIDIILLALGVGDKRKQGKNTIKEIVSRCIVQGLKNKEIALCIGKSVSSVRYYLDSLYREFEVDNRKDLARRLNLSL